MLVYKLTHSVVAVPKEYLRTHQGGKAVLQGLRSALHQALGPQQLAYRQRYQVRDMGAGFFFHRLAVDSPIYADRCVPLKPLRVDSALRALSTLRGLRGAPEVPPLCRETQSLGHTTILDIMQIVI